MCNYMGYTVTKQQYIRLKQIEKQFGAAAALEELRSAFVYGEWATLVATPDKKDVLVKMMHWEFIPNFVHSLKEMELIRKGIDPKTGARKKPIPWVNAKAENLLQNEQGRKSMWADAARKNRCLIVATHFFEWRHYKPATEKKPIAYPYKIDFFKENEPLYMAGIYNTWTDKETGETMDCFAHVTTAANSIMAQIHNTKMRQPTILTEDLAWRWIMDDLSDEELLSIARYQLPAEQFSFHTIRKDFRETGLLEPFEYEELPAINAAL